MNCNFPAARLLAVRRKISEAKGIDVIRATKFIRAIDKVRRAHEEKTGCQCWYSALESNYHGSSVMKRSEYRVQI